MARAAPRPCPYPGCGVLVAGGHCEKHQRAVRRQSDQQRGSSSARLYGSKWRAARAQFLSEHPLCQCAECASSGFPALSQVVDHKVPHRGDLKLFWNRRNWMAMAKTCHDRKTARDDGGFGNRNRRTVLGEPGAP